MTIAHTHEEVATAPDTIDPVLVEQANDAEVERQLLFRCHPTEMERIAHRTGDCDGSCARMYNGFEHLLDSDLDVTDPVLIEQANDAEVERQLLFRCHPTEMERIAHRTGDCDGSCARMYNGFEYLLDS